MQTSTFVILGIVLVVVVYAVMIYNSLVSLKHGVAKAWANIDVLLKQRHDEVPKLVETCKQYMRYEQKTLEGVMTARSSVAVAREAGDVAAVGVAESRLRQGLGNLFALAEAYPDLKANESFHNLRSLITGLENRIADRREFYNDIVKNNNVRLEQFPDAIVARWFDFRPAELLEFAEQEIRGVNLRALFG